MIIYHQNNIAGFAGGLIRYEINFGQYVSVTTIFVNTNARVRIVNPNREFASNGLMSQDFLIWTRNVTQFETIIGTGSPEGQISALPTRVYMDETGATGSLIYIKRDADIGGDTKKGWILI